MALVSDPVVEGNEAGCHRSRMDICPELGQTVTLALQGFGRLIRRSKLGRKGAAFDALLLYFFQETWCVQLAFKQIREVSLHETFRLFLDLGAGSCPSGIRVAGSLEVAHVLERMARDRAHAFFTLAAFGTEHAALLR